MPRCEHALSQGEINSYQHASVRRPDARSVSDSSMWDR